MRTRILSVLFFAVCVVLVSSCNQYQYDFYSSIDGVVVDGNSTPLEGARVTISPGGVNVLTASDGTFVFSELEKTKYTITAQKEGYSTDRKEVSTYAGETINITLILRK